MDNREYLYYYSPQFRESVSIIELRIEPCRSTIMPRDSKPCIGRFIMDIGLFRLPEWVGETAKPPSEMQIFFFYHYEV
jgi:hypothetical protein